MKSEIRFIAEAGQTMRGDIGLAVEMVHAFAEAGATHFKVQMLNPMTIATDDARSYWQTGPPVLQRESFSANGVIPYDGWSRVRAACADARIGFVATPFDLAAVEALRDLDPAAVKVASGDITFRPLVEAVARLGKLTFLSTGASDLDEVHEAMSWYSVASTAGAEGFVVPFACTLKYPTPLTQARLRRVHALRERYRVAGYSDHTVETVTSLPAVCAGATYLEKHVTPYPGRQRTDDVVVPDDAMGLGVREFAEYVKRGIDGERLMLHPGEYVDEDEARRGARRAARFARSLDAGVEVKMSDVTFLRPDPDGDGRSIELVMRRAETLVPVAAGDLVSRANVCGAI